MKFTSALPIVTLVLGITAEPVLVNREPSLTERDAATVTNILNAVGSGISTLDTAVNGFSGDVSSIDSDSAALQKTINDGTTSAKAATALTLQEAVGLTTPVTSLQTVGTSLVNDLIAKKSAFEAKGLCSDINTQITGINTASTALISAIVALVPSAAQSLASSLAQPFQDALASGVAAYASGNCTDAVAATSSTPAAASSSAAVVSSSAATSTAAAVSSSAATGSSTVAVSSSAAVVTATPTSKATGTGAITKTSASATVSFTNAAEANYASNSFGIIALAAAAMVL